MSALGFRSRANSQFFKVDRRPVPTPSTVQYTDPSTSSKKRKDLTPEHDLSISVQSNRKKQRRKSTAPGDQSLLHVSTPGRNLASNAVSKTALDADVSVMSVSSKKKRKKAKTQGENLVSKPTETALPDSGAVPTLPLLDANPKKRRRDAEEQGEPSSLSEPKKRKKKAEMKPPAVVSTPQHEVS